MEKSKDKFNWVVTAGIVILLISGCLLFVIYHLLNHFICVAIEKMEKWIK